MSGLRPMTTAEVGAHLKRIDFFPKMIDAFIKRSHPSDGFYEAYELMKTLPNVFGIDVDDNQQSVFYDFVPPGETRDFVIWDNSSAYDWSDDEVVLEHLKKNGGFFLLRVKRFSGQGKGAVNRLFTQHKGDDQWEELRFEFQELLNRGGVFSIDETERHEFEDAIRFGGATAIEGNNTKYPIRSSILEFTNSWKKNRSSNRSISQAWKAYLVHRRHRALLDENQVGQKVQKIVDYMNDTSNILEFEVTRSVSFKDGKIQLGEQTTHPGSRYISLLWKPRMLWTTNQPRTFREGITFTFVKPVSCANVTCTRDSQGKRRTCNPRTGRCVIVRRK